MVNNAQCSCVLQTFCWTVQIACELPWQEIINNNYKKYFVNIIIKNEKIKWFYWLLSCKYCKFNTLCNNI